MSSSLTLYKLEDELLAWANSFEMGRYEGQGSDHQEGRPRRGRYSEMVQAVIPGIPVTINPLPGGSREPPIFSLWEAYDEDDDECDEEDEPADDE